MNKEYVEGLLSRYKGNALGYRLLSVSASCSGEVQLFALLSGVSSVTVGTQLPGGAQVWNTVLYATLLSRLQTSHPGALKPDTAWVAATDAKMAALQSELEQESQQANSSAIRDTMRVRGSGG
jgi:hypothetical protein